MQAPGTITVGEFIAARGHLLELAEGAPLFFEGDRSHSVYVCLEGTIRIFITLPSGRELVMGRKHPGEAFGELSAIDARPRSASAVAIEPSIVAHMAGEQFLDELHHEPALAIAVLRGLTDQLRLTNARLRAHNAESAMVRCGHMLVELSMLKLRHDRRAEHIELAITQADISEWIGATRESTARALAKFRSEGVVETGRGRIVVHDVRGLARLIESS